MGRYIIDERMRQIYEEEHSKLISTPDLDSDFIALDRAWERYHKEKETTA